MSRRPRIRRGVVAALAAVLAVALAAGSAAPAWAASPHLPFGPIGSTSLRGPQGTVHLAAPITAGVADAATPGAYWLVGADGGVFAFGGAPYLGSLPGLGIKPVAPIVGIVATPHDHGYWLVGADGGVFAFGSAPFYGSAAGPGGALVEGPVTLTPVVEAACGVKRVAGYTISWPTGSVAWHVGITCSVAPAAPAVSAPPRGTTLLATSSFVIARRYTVSSSPLPGASWAQTRISVPASIRWTAADETVGAWIALSTARGAMRVGWQWAEGSAPTLAVATWSGGRYVVDPAYPPSADDPAPVPGGSINVIVTDLTAGGHHRAFSAFVSPPAPFTGPAPQVAPSVPTSTTTGSNMGVGVGVVRVVASTTPAGSGAPTASPSVAFSGGTVAPFGAPFGGGPHSYAQLPPTTLQAGGRAVAGPVSPAALLESGVPADPTSGGVQQGATGVTHSEHAFAVSQAGTNHLLIWERATVSVPTGVHWTRPGRTQMVSAWVMANADRHRWDQVGWEWAQGFLHPRLFVETGSGAFHTFEALPPGGSITVAVGCDLGTTMFTNWVEVAGRWQLLDAVNANQPCGLIGGRWLIWTRALEDVRAVGAPQPTPAQPVTFSDSMAADAAGAAIHLPPLTAARGGVDG